ncbi:diaminopimelate epimerase [Fibrella aquatilis]|uniref:Diaminopimelate epimerase n=1 Tax=Fibrella aquatilis TaxID=2817059 RepID=A0A939G8J5_9BACT|nr:diaminopimelate epimerase [Fibrella aquatilis]MBO0932046.1 diaminopimelate epimerase [Fibrella aquatilis]
MTFFKYQGTGNDFVMIDDRARTFPSADQALVAQLCHRHFGIGADGLILLQTAPDGALTMVYFNADGAEGSMCGNGGRCFVRFAHDLGLITDQARFMAVDGEHEAEVRGTDIHLRMSDVASLEHHTAFSFLNTGSPHVVQFEADVASLDVVAVGRPMRYAAQFSPGGTNINFVETQSDQTLFVRTYERGVEDETYSCGTGVTAAALVAHIQLNLSSPVAIRTLGGNLRVAFTAQPGGGFTSIYLIGPAQRVFEGEITV